MAKKKKLIESEDNIEASAILEEMKKEAAIATVENNESAESDIDEIAATQTTEETIDIQEETEITKEQSEVVEQPVVEDTPDDLTSKPMPDTIIEETPATEETPIAKTVIDETPKSKTPTKTSVAKPTNNKSSRRTSLTYQEMFGRPEFGLIFD